MEKNIRPSVSKIGYVVSGAVVGSVLGLLFAPRAGAATRDQMSLWLREKKLNGRVAMHDAIETGRRTFRRNVKSLSGA